MERKLASIQVIRDIQPIPGADSILKARINDWWVVISKTDNYNIGDFVIYFEIDTWMPHALAPFLSKGKAPKLYEGIQGQVLKTIRLRGQISQWLILALNSVLGLEDSPTEGLDLTETLSLMKYAPTIPTSVSGDIAGIFPSQVPKTDEERIQNLTSEWEILSQYTYEVTEKLEGCSMSVGIVNGEFVVCSRNYSLKETENNKLWKLARKYDIKAKMRDIGLDHLMISGECIGEGVQGNYYEMIGNDFYIFSIYNTALGCYLAPEARIVACNALGLRHVPILYKRSTVARITVEEILRYADGGSMSNPAKLREGLVFNSALRENPPRSGGGWIARTAKPSLPWNLI